ncbi:putative EF-hand calcium-binding domain-containing protein 5 [Hypsibius exemplaris]|uniref:EF-hand calcium-binding domain-containing protein 5 n=1 Tax=Hypsibius exemplaris TaxID=2072580 RepID=A0A9X6NDH5_HYPEX|nr:putative EF-hand calcium-binding domain-containing protein 5 [Hypsibius exemplaris]
MDTIVQFDPTVNLGIVRLAQLAKPSEESQLMASYSEQIQYAEGLVGRCANPHSQRSGNGNLDILFRDIIELIEKDGQIHSGNKVIAASIALLEHNTLNPAKGKFLLRFVAASDRESRYLINRIYLPESQNIGFRVAQAGRPGRIEKISQNDTPLPVSSERKQAVLCCLSEGFVQIQTQRKCIVALAEGLPWFHILLPTVVDIQMYWVEPDRRVNDTPTLRRVVSTAGGSSPAVVYPNPAVYRQGDPGFFDRLLCCATSAENVKETLFKERHLACPLRDKNNFAIIVLDINFGSDWPKATKETDVVNLLVICQKTLNEVLSTMSGTFPQLAIQKQFPERQHRFIFHRLLLVDLRQVCKRIQASTLSDIRTAPDSSQVHQQILKAILTAFHPAESEQGYFDRWSGCKDAVRLDLMDTIVQFDPTVNLGIRSARTISKAFREIVQLSEESVTVKHPIFQYFYRWITVCSRLLESSEAVRNDPAMQEGVSSQAYLTPTAGVATDGIPFRADPVPYKKKGKSKKGPS